MKEWRRHQASVSRVVVGLWESPPRAAKHRAVPEITSLGLVGATGIEPVTPAV